MLNFRATGGADFGYSVDFSDVDYANVSFFDKPGKNILFHLSLRRKTGLAVVNTRVDGIWSGEIPKEVTLARQGDKVHIGFEQDDVVQITLNGKELFRFDADFVGLSEITHVNFNGALQPDTLEIAGDANLTRDGLGALDLGAFLDVEGWAIDPGLPSQNPQLDVEGLDEPILFERLARPDLAAKHKLTDDRVGVYAFLPGRVWESVTQGQDLNITLKNNDFSCGEPLKLTRKEVLQRIERLCLEEGVETRTFETLLAIEHVFFGDFWDHLSPRAQGVLKNTATTYGVSDLVGAPDAKTAIIPPVNPERILMSKIRAEFELALARTDSPDCVAILSTLLDDYPLAPAQQQHLFLVLTDELCRLGQFEDLYRFAKARNLHSFEPGDNNWHNTSILPFICLDRRLDELQALLWQITHAHGEGEKGGWISSSALKWTVQYLVNEGIAPETLPIVEKVIFGFMALVDKCSLRYFDYAQNVELIDATVTLLAQKKRLPEYFPDHLEKFALRVFGLSNKFWERAENEVARGNLHLGPGLVSGQSNFEVIRQHLINPKVDIEPALIFFQFCNTVDVQRFRLELLGPLGRQPKKGQDVLAETFNTGLDIADNVLRYHAFPGTPAPTSPETDLVLRDAIRARYAKTHKAPYYGVQASTSRDIFALLASLGSEGGGDRIEPLKSILRNLRLLASKPSKYLGIGMAIGLLQALIRAGHQDLALHVMAWIGAIRAEVPKEDQTGLFEMPAIHGALMSLQVMTAQQNSELADATIRMFPRFNPGSINLPVQGVAAPQWHAASPLFDTLVVILSCQPNLDSRVAKMRNGWLSKLKELGVPYLIVVGGGDGQLDGDVLRVDASDTYEGLPQKTLATVEWIYKNTPFPYMLKIDDDCFLNPDEFFHSQSYRKFNYYGRRLQRVVGQMDRTWHFAKSTSERGCKELDKSPEPSEYGDGGSGYALSRKAMQCVTQNSRTEAGLRLISASFMEDKMIGDLLSMSDIKISDEDYYVSIRRRSHSGATPVAMWENSFNAGRSSVVKQVHLDNQDDQATAFDHLEKSGLYPRKIWPTYGKARLGDATNILELISDQSKLDKLNAEPLAVVACMHNEMFMLPHFLAHYRKLGVKAFLLADNCSDDGTLDYLLQQPDVVAFSADTPYGQSQYGVAWQVNILANLRVGRWSLMADTDELLVYPGWEKTKLPKLVAGKAFQNADAARIYMLDMYPQGRLSEAGFDSGDPFAEAGFVDKAPFIDRPTGRGPFSDASTVTSALRHRLIPSSRPDLFVAQKIALLKYKPWMRLSAGLHYVADTKLSQTEMLFAHFKYNAHFRQKALAETARGQHFNNAEEYRNYLALTSEGREVIFDPDVSVHWRDCETVKRMLGQ